MNLVFLGPPGSGKGTQAVRLAEKLSLVHLSTGDVLRDAVKRGTELGKKAEGFMSRGELVPDAVLIDLIENLLTTGKLNGGFILDGFPRTVPQATGLKQMLDNNAIRLDKAVLFDVGDQEIIKRLSGRWFCPKCNAGYNYPAKLPRVEGRCDNDDAELQRRPDDEEAVVKNRLEVYRKQTRPIEEFYRGESILTSIEGQRSPDEVFQSLLDEVGG
ncbi:MAG: adenylate kinase [Candidatus Zixiibacteriota bacterium]|nr:MAG: adenylate kinase [candidate division Zixibacteria bacterium]